MLEVEADLSDSDDIFEYFLQICLLPGFWAVSSPSLIMQRSDSSAFSLPVVILYNIMWIQLDFSQISIPFQEGQFLPILKKTQPIQSINHYHGQSWSKNCFMEVNVLHWELQLAELPNYFGIQSQMDSVAFVFGMKEYLQSSLCIIKDRFKVIFISLVMSEVLKEYRLYEELTRINHDEYFQPTFKTLELQQVFSSILNEKDYANDKSCFFFFYNLKAMGKKKPYLVLKWLIVTHQLLEMPLYMKVIQDIYRTLETIQTPTGSTPFETYFYETLIKVYLQYLLKFSLYKLKKAVAHPERFPNFESQLFFMRVNLLKFGTNEFMGLIPEFRGFLEDSYPFLTSYSKLVEGDLKVIYKELKKEHRRQEEKLINWKQIEDYDDFLHTISEHNLSSTGCDDILSEGGFSPCKIKQFLLSGTKILDKFANEEDTMA